MTYRNDLDAAHARIEALEREKRELAEQNEWMNARLGTPRTRRLDSSSASYEPSPWPFVGMIGVMVAFFIVMVAGAAL